MSDELEHTSKVKAWISAMRLRTLPLSFSVIIVGNALAIIYTADIENQTNHFNWLIFALTLLTTLFLQVLSNFANDYGDGKKGTDNEERIGPERAVQSGVLSLKEMKLGIIITALFSFVSGLILLLVSMSEKLDLTFFLFIGLGILAIIAAIKYTVGKGAYGYYALGDLFVFIFFGIIGVCGSLYLQVLEFHWPPLIFASIMGFFCVAVLNLNNMRDRENDAKVGKKTMAVILGFEKSKTYHLSLFLLAWSPWVYAIFSPADFMQTFSLIFAPIFIFHLFHVIKVLKTAEPRDFDPELKKVALSTFVYSIVLFTIIYYTFY